MKTLECKSLFDSLKIIDRLSYTEYMSLQNEYPDDFLAGRYRQEVILYESKIYVFGAPFILSPYHVIKDGKKRRTFTLKC